MERTKREEAQGGKPLDRKEKVTRVKEAIIQNLCSDTTQVSYIIWREPLKCVSEKSYSDGG